MTLTKIGRYGTRNMYLSPDGRSGMRYAEAKAAHANVERLLSDLNAEVAYGLETGLGDHGKVDNLIASIRTATGKNPWELR
jgi:hypothetical protein